jgi:hypothetical protein
MTTSAFYPALESLESAISVIEYFLFFGLQDGRQLLLQWFYLFAYFLVCSASWGKRCCNVCFDWFGVCGVLSITA